MVAAIPIVSDDEEYDTDEIESVLSDDDSFHSVLDAGPGSSIAHTEDFLSAISNPSTQQFLDALSTEEVTSSHFSSARASLSSTSTGDSDFVKGEPVLIVGGVHKGKKATFEKRTPKRIGIKLDESPHKIKYLQPDNVRHLTHPSPDETVTSARLNPVVHDAAPQRSSDTRNSDELLQAGSLPSEANTEQFRSVTPERPNRQFRYVLPSEVVTSAPISGGRVSVSYSGDSDFFKGEPVLIVGGVYKGKKATVEKRTPKRIGVTLDESPGNIKYLQPDNVRHLTHPSPDETVSSERLNPVVHNTACQRSSEARTRNSDELLQPGARCSEANAEQFRSVTPDRPNGQFRDILSSEVVTSVPISSGRDSVSSTRDGGFVQGELLLVVGGVHDSKQATFEKRTSARIGVRLDKSPDKVTYLAPHNVRSLARASSTRSYHVVHDEAHFRSPQRTVPASGTSAGVASPFAVAGGEDEMLHSHLGLREDFCKLLFPNEKSNKDKTFAAKIFGSRIRTFEVNMTGVSEKLPKDFLTATGRRYELLCSKVQRQKGGSWYMTTMKASVHYVMTEGPGVPRINLREELEKLAGFGRLTPEKVAARLELLFSTARAATFNKAKRPYLIFDDLTTAEFEEIPELANEGCGFIPREYIHRFLGTRKVGLRTFAIQVRIFAPHLGTFKGVLMEKPGIDRIQLPSSMHKVGPSESCRDDRACLMITAIAPSNTNLQVSKILEGGGACKSFSPTRLSKMAVSLLKSVGVPEELVMEYVETSYGNRGWGLQHTSLLGVADPTNAIPAGHIFLTGVQNTVEIDDEAFVTRFPCTESGDGHVLPVVRIKPEGMTDASWSFLQTLDFGGIIFGNPGPGEGPLPASIANGDLDGDLYLTCWNDQFLGSIQREELFAVLDDDPMAIAFSDRPWNTNWLSEAQDLMRDIPSMKNLSDLIGRLHTLWKKGIEDGDSDAVWFGRAYKEALDIGKHGGQVKLPSSIWNKLPVKLHGFLYD